jgi:transposase
VKNQLHFLAMSQGVCRKRKLWSARGRAVLEGLQLGAWARQRRKELLELLDRLEPQIQALDQAVKAEAERCPEAVQLMKHKGVGPVTALAFVLTVGPVERFPNSRKLVSYLGLNPSEDSSGDRQKLGHISRQGNAMMRWLLVEAGQSAAQFDRELQRKYLRLKYRRGGKVAKVALARRLAVRLYWTLHQAKAPASAVHTSSRPAQTMVDASPSRF